MVNYPYIPQMESSSPSNLSDGYTTKENCMTTTVRGAVREQATEEQGGAEQDIYPLLLATLMGRRQEGEERGGMIAPLLMAAMATRGEERGEEMTPLLMAAMATRGEERREEITPLVLAALMGRRQEREKETV